MLELLELQELLLHNHILKLSHKFYMALLLYRP
jgi:hypothetical protein